MDWKHFFNTQKYGLKIKSNRTICVYVDIDLFKLINLTKPVECIEFSSFLQINKHSRAHINAYNRRRRRSKENN